MSLNIKDPEAHRLAQAVAKATGETMTRAVTVALRERLERLQESKNKVSAEALLAIGRSCAELLTERPADHGEGWLYDEHGLPK
ncbi:MAG: type II toxin-antitoxin system VapB family antitoxin [Alphaproteobacteria bacterium]